MLTAENNRLPLATKRVAKRIAVHLGWLEKELERTNRDLDGAIKSSPTLRENEALLRSVPGVGPVHWLGRYRLRCLSSRRAHAQATRRSGWGCSSQP
jgi:hypothetical protein